MTPPTSGEARRQARRIALAAAALSLGVYLLAAIVADLFVLHELQTRLDRRLTASIVALAGAQSSALGRLASAGAGGGDPDDAPVFAWRVTASRGAGAIRRLSGPLTPALSQADAAAARTTRGLTPAVAQMTGHSFLLVGLTTPSGELVVGTSAGQLSSERLALLAGEAVLLPVFLVAVFLVAELIGVRAAAPVERARLDQLDFTADASHELRTPLSVIEAEVGLALACERDAAHYKAALGRVSAESRRLRGIVDDLLWLAHADAVPTAPRTVPVRLAPIVQSCAERFRPVVAQNGGSLLIGDAVAPALGGLGAGGDGNGTLPADAAHCEDGPIVEVPAEWVDRLVSVLVDNACRYAGQMAVVEVGVTATAGRAVLRVDDNGPGVPPEQRDAVQRRFHRASVEQGGAGLGLSIAAAIVQATRGDLAITTSPLGGARVEVTWPLASLAIGEPVPL